MTKNWSRSTLRFTLVKRYISKNPSVVSFLSVFWCVLTLVGWFPPSCLLQLIFGRLRRSAWARSHETSSDMWRTRRPGRTRPTASSSSTGQSFGSKRSVWQVDEGMTPVCYHTSFMRSHTRSPVCAPQRPQTRRWPCGWRVWPGWCPIRFAPPHPCR